MAAIPQDRRSNQKRENQREIIVERIEEWQNNKMREGGNKKSPKQKEEMSD